jgi:hypothetical protein
MPSGTLLLGTKAKATILTASALWLIVVLAGAQPVGALERLRDEPDWSGGAGMTRALELTDE